MELRDPEELLQESPFIRWNPERSPINGHNGFSRPLRRPLRHWWASFSTTPQCPETNYCRNICLTTSDRTASINAKMELNVTNSTVFVSYSASGESYCVY